jgi:erythronate-4-phosphate dehydrogenase
MSLRVVADQNIPGVQEYFARLGEVQLVDGRGLGRRQLTRADILLVRSVTRVDEHLVRGTPLRFVGTATSGVDHVDRECLAGLGIGFAAAPGGNANSVVEYILAAIAAVDDALERLLAGERVGVVGFGHIGSALVARLQALGIECRVSDPWLEPSRVTCPAELAEVLSCDVVTLHPELTRQRPWPSYHLIDAKALGRMGRGQLLINASRGEVVDGRALVQRLAGGDGPVTVLDVWEGEPRIDHHLASLVRLGSPHIAGYSLDGKLRGTRMLRDAVCAHLGAEMDNGGPTPDDRPTMTLPPGTEGADLVRHLISASYDIALDDTLLREVLRSPDPGQGFDRLRRDYRVRRELAGQVVEATDASPAQLAVAEALGCRVVEGAE